MATTGHESEAITVQGLKASLQKYKDKGRFVHQMNSAPTTSTTTYTIGTGASAKTYSFKIGDEIRVPDNSASSESNGYSYYKLYDLVTENNTTTAYWDLSGSGSRPLTVNSIKNLTGAQIEKLNAGNIVIKSAFGKNHAYIVSYKKANEMCLTYTDHENVEEVYYEKTDDTWAWVQTDNTPIGDGAFLKNASGTAVTPSFDPQTDTVWNKAQVLTSAQKAQVKANLDIQDIVFNTAYNATTNKAATMADVPNASDFVQKSQTAGLLKNDGTVDTNTYLTSAPVTSVNGQTGAVTLTIPDVTGKEDKVAVESASGATLTAQAGKYYTISDAGTLAITLPTIAAGTTTLQVVSFYISAGSSPAVTFTSTHSIYYSEGFEIAASTTYEVNAMYNGIAWVVTSVKIVIPSA